MMIIGSIAIVYGLPYSNSVLFLYGGEKLSETGIATRLLQANCLYILVMAVNGITETFTFAAMTQDQLDKYNQKLVIFSAVFLAGSFLFVHLFGSIGFFIANGLNMSLRVSHSVYLIRDVFARCDFNPFDSWKPKRLINILFVGAFLTINLLQILFQYGRFPHIAVGLFIFAFNIFAIYAHEKELLHFFVQLFKNKPA
jgi:oligosaccharide translocation protein RFT1